MTDAYGLWAISGSYYEVFGGSFEITGTGLQLSSISFSAGLGLDGGFSWDPTAAPKEEETCAAPGSNSIGLYVSGDASVFGVGVDASAEGGVDLTPDTTFNPYSTSGINGQALSLPKVEAEVGLRSAW